MFEGQLSAHSCPPGRGPRRRRTPNQSRCPERQELTSRTCRTRALKRKEERGCGDGQASGKRQRRGGRAQRAQSRSTHGGLSVNPPGFSVSSAGGVRAPSASISPDMDVLTPPEKSGGRRCPGLRARPPRWDTPGLVGLPGDLETSLTAVFDGTCVAWMLRADRRPRQELWGCPSGILVNPKTLS